MGSEEKQRLEKLQTLADTILEKLRIRVLQEEPEKMNMQSIKHITGVMKDLRDIQLTRAETEGDGLQITVVWEGELEKYSE